MLLALFVLSLAMKWYGKDLNIYSDNPFRFSEERYVGGDAYNYIISAARSSAVVGKSIFWSLSRCSALVRNRGRGKELL